MRITFRASQLFLTGMAHCPVHCIDTYLVLSGELSSRQEGQRIRSGSLQRESYQRFCGIRSGTTGLRVQALLDQTDSFPADLTRKRTCHKYFMVQRNATQQVLPTIPCVYFPRPPFTVGGLLEFEGKSSSIGENPHFFLKIPEILLGFRIRATCEVICCLSMSHYGGNGPPEAPQE